MRIRSLLVAACALALACPLACNGERKAARVLLVGVDGLEWNVLRPLIAQGRCPNLRALMERGSFGRLATMEPTLSPILWTTIATGRRPEEHGILGFLHGDQQQYTSSQRKVRAVWDVAGVHGLESSVFGWWITWPVSDVRGVMVSGSSSSALSEANWKPALMPGAPKQVHPPELEREVMAIAEKTGALDEVRRLAREKVFGELPAGSLGPVEKRLIQETLWSIQADATTIAVAREELRERPADLELVYFGGPDVVGHRFWRYYEPAPFRWPAEPALKEKIASPEGARALAGVIPRYYAWVDEMLGGLIEAAGPDTTVIVCSDHGMHADFTDAPHPLFLTGHHLDAPPGIVVAAGPGIARRGGLDAFLAGGEAPLLGHVLGVTPTLLALLGIPSSNEMPGSAIVEMLDGAAKANASMARVASHDEGYRPPEHVELPRAMNESFVKRFRDLGYIGSDEEPEPR